MLNDATGQTVRMKIRMKIRMMMRKHPLFQLVGSLLSRFTDYSPFSLSFLVFRFWIQLLRIQLLLPLLLLSPIEMHSDNQEDDDGDLSFPLTFFLS
jgi:hypothetical protein